MAPANYSFHGIFTLEYPKYEIKQILMEDQNEKKVPEQKAFRYHPNYTCTYNPNPYEMKQEKEPLIKMGNDWHVKIAEVDKFDEAFEAEWIINDKKKEEDKDKEKEMAGRHSIHEMIVFRDFHGMTTPPENQYSWRDTDRKLFNLGIRIGQTWLLKTANYESFLAPIGYHKKGFIWVGLKIHPNLEIISKIFADRNIGKKKSNFISYLENKGVTLNSTVQSKFLDENGLALPKHEIDVTLAGLKIPPMFWHDPILDRDFFVSFCENGHYVFSNTPISIGSPCGDICHESKHTDAAKSLFEYIIQSAMRIDLFKSNIVFKPTTTIPKCAAFAPFININSIREGIRLRTAFSQEHIKTPAWVPFVENTSEIGKTTNRFKKENLKSGDIFPLISDETGKRIFVKLHRRTCGNFHFEISKTMIFSGETDWKYIKDILRNRSFTLGEEKKGLSLSVNKPFIRCPICNSNDPLLILSKTTIANSKGPKILFPLTPAVIRKRTLPSKGDIVLYKKNPCIVDDNRKENLWHGKIDKHTIVVIDRQDHKKLVKMNKIRIVEKPTKELKAQFYDKDGFFIRKKLNLNNWTKAITSGTILVALKGSLAGQEVFCTSEPFKMGNDWHVQIAESETTMSLYTDLRLKKNYSVTTRNVFKHTRNMNNIYTITKIENGVVSIKQTSYKKDIYKENNIHIAKLGLDILIDRKELQNAKTIQPASLALELGAISNEEYSNFEKRKIHEDIQKITKNNKIWQKQKEKLIIKQPVDLEPF